MTHSFPTLRSSELARLLELLSRERDASQVLNALPQSISTPELQLKLKEGENFTLIDRLQKEAKFPGSEQTITIDGVRVEYAEGRSEEHTYELQSLMRNSYAGSCMQQKKKLS